jgi:hypothetical protein
MVQRFQPSRREFLLATAVSASTVSSLSGQAGATGIMPGNARYYFFRSGTTTRSPVFADERRTILQPDPIILKDGGHDRIFLDPKVRYRLVVKDATGRILDDIDPYVSGQANDASARVAAVGLFAELSRISVQSGTDLIQTSGCSRVGLGAALYVRDPETTALSSRAAELMAAAVAQGVNGRLAESALIELETKWRKADASGQYWTLLPAQRIEDTMFGAVHDAVKTGSATARWNSQWAGTDDRPAIQAMIDWSLYFRNNPEVYLAKGATLLGDTLHIGYGTYYAGTFFVSLSLRGSGYGTWSNAGTNETVLARNFCGKPLINIASARGVLLDQFATYGVLGKYISEGFVCSNVHIAGVGLASDHAEASPRIDDTVPSGWDDPEITAALGRNQDHRYAPDCAICVDGYAGAAPSTLYPPTPYPAWYAPGRTHYHKDATSQDVNIAPTGMACYGETNFVTACPSGNIDANTDYISIGKLVVHNTKRVASFGHTQMHGFKIDYCFGNVCYEIVANNVHGKQMGRLDGSIQHVNFNGLIQLGSFGSSILAGPVTFRNCYVENAYRVLTTEGGHGYESPIRLEQCDMIFDLHTDWRGAPAYVIGKAGTAAVADVPVEIVGGHFKGFRGAFNCRTPVTITGSASFDAFETGVQHGPANLASFMACFHNGTAGGIVLPRLASTDVRGRPHDSLYWQRNIDTGAAFASHPCSANVVNSDRIHCLPFWAPSGTPRKGRILETIVNPQRRAQYDKADFSGVSTSGAGDHYAWRFTTSVSADIVERYGGATGDLLVDGETGMVFVVSSYSAATGATVARALTGIRKRRSAWAPIPSFQPASGTMYAACLRNYIPGLPAFATFISASTEAVDVGQSNGASVAAEIAIGDRVHQDDLTDHWVASPHTAIRTFDPAAGTMRLSGPVIHGGKRRLAVLTRTVPDG